ncbi:glycoside hydrolase family 15 protein [Amycolatopsis aidingensis]|uniref:glycoside hydrolase family 15 protein n=1 Tax=Amycolatopsis aidingensis TaxID=2842453 RepID=UPI001C0D51D5|nr:glycoside hydrolase family 15 protein [Amycolatopsis aidingensis]
MSPGTPSPSSGEPPPEVLRDYALLADGERGALIGSHGEIGWLCVPRWDSAAVFCTLLGGRGHYTVRPSGKHFVPGGFYEDGSLIWRSRWMLGGGAIECREALVFPGDPHSAVLLRRIHAVDGDAAVTVVLEPRADFDREPMRSLRRDHGGWRARVGPLHLRWTGAEQARKRGSSLVAELAIPAGTTHDLVLELSDRPLSGAPADPAAAWEATAQQWSTAVPGLADVLGSRDARRAYAVQRGLTSTHGGMVAAATTSLPERARAGRNYDYRYTWIRDQCFTAQAVAAIGADGDPLLDNAADFVAERLHADGPRLSPVYTVSGQRVPDERPIGNLPGYPGGAARTGNRAVRGFQLDAFGEALLMFAAAARRGRLDSRHWRAVDIAVDAIERRCDEPDAGIWELDEEHWAHSRLSCVAGLRAMAATGPPHGRAGRWSALADTILADAARDCVHPSGRWQRSARDDRVDAALLLPAVRGALPADDPRSVATLDAVRTELAEDGYVYRFRHDQRPLHAAEGAFLLCGFLTALACRQRGQEVEARGWFERSRAACGPPGLYAEEFDVVQHQLRGNLPQAFVHALFLEAGCRLSDPAA